MEKRRPYWEGIRQSRVSEDTRRGFLDSPENHARIRDRKDGKSSEWEDEKVVSTRSGRVGENWGMSFLEEKMRHVRNLLEGLERDYSR